LTGELVDAAWAHANGFVSEVVAPDELDGRMAELAGAFDDASRSAVAATKAMLNDRFGDLLDAALRRETDACVRLFDRDDARRAVQAFVAR
jgi:enoyl-CoA hydratase/carnithine racemase